jgi:hypothetical protein
MKELFPKYAVASEGAVVVLLVIMTITLIFATGCTTMKAHSDLYQKNVLDCQCDKPWGEPFK